MSATALLKLAEKIAKNPAPCTHEHAKRALILYFLKRLESSICKSTKT
jgi:hypothetical protein